jgi:hypothetical protein
METAPVPGIEPKPLLTTQLPKEPGRVALWLLIFAAWLFASFLRLYWVEEAYLPNKQPVYQRNGEILPNTHDSYMFGAIIQKALLGMHTANKEVESPYKHGLITLLPTKVLGWFNGPVFDELNRAANEMEQASKELKKLANNTEDNATHTLLNTDVDLAEQWKTELRGTHPTPHDLRDSARQAAEAARKIAQDLTSYGKGAASIHDSFKRAEHLATSAAKRPMLSVEQIMTYMPAFVASMFAIPLVLIGRLLGSTWWGFLAALIGASANSYYNRSMAGYFDTDMFSVTLPALALYFFLRALNQRTLWPAVAGAVTLFVYPFFYHGGMPVSLSLAVAFIGYQLIFHWRETVSWQCVVPVTLAVIFLDSSLGHIMAAHPVAWSLKLGAIIGSAVALRWIPFFRTESSLPNWQIRTITGMTLAAFVLFSSQLNYLRNRVYQYLPSETKALSTSAETTRLQYKNFMETIQEARGIDQPTLARRLSGTVVGGVLTAIGYGLLVARHPQCLIAMPLVGIGLFALMGGLRFTIHAVGIAALSVTWIFFAHESCRLGRTILAGFFGGLAGASGWLWLAWLSGNHSGGIDLLLLPAGVVAGYAALITGHKGLGETPTTGQRAWIAVGGCGTGMLVAKVIAVGLSMGGLFGALGGSSIIQMLLAILIAAAIPMSRHPRFVPALGSWINSLTEDTRPRILAACLGAAAMTGLLLGHHSHLPAEEIYQQNKNALAAIRAAQAGVPVSQKEIPRSLTQFQIQAFIELQKQYEKQRIVWRELMLQGQLGTGQLGSLLRYLPRQAMTHPEFTTFLKEARTNPKFKKLLAESQMADAKKNLAAAASQPLGLEGLILGTLVGLAGAWTARGGKRLEAMVMAGGATFLGLFILLTIKCGFLGLQLGGMLTSSGFLLGLLALGLSIILAGALPGSSSGTGNLGLQALATATAGGLGWLWLGEVFGTPLLPVLPVLGLWSGWMMTRVAPSKHESFAVPFAGLALLGMVVVALLTATTLTPPGRHPLLGHEPLLVGIAQSSSLWLWAASGSVLAAFAAVMTRPGMRTRITLPAGVAGVLTACGTLLLLVLCRKVMASFLPAASGALVLLNNLGLCAMGVAVGLVVWRVAPDRRNPTLTWMAGAIACAGALVGMAAGGTEYFVDWAQTQGVLWLLIGGLAAGTMPMAMEQDGHFRKLAAGLAAGTGAGVLWALLAHAAGHPMTLAFWPVGAVVGGAVALTGEDNDGWPAPAIAVIAALLGMAAGLTALDWQSAQLGLLNKPGALAGLATAALLPVLCRVQWQAAAAGLMAALAGSWIVVWTTLMLTRPGISQQSDAHGEPIALLLWPLGGLVGFTVARNGEKFPPNFRPVLAAALALIAGLAVTMLTSGNGFSWGSFLMGDGGIWLALGAVTAGLAPLVFSEESLPGRTVIAGLVAALLGGLTWGWLAREMNVTGKPGVEPLTFGPWIIGALTGLAVTWAARKKNGWLPPVTAALSALAGVATGLLVMGTYGSLTLLTPVEGQEALGRALSSWSQFNNPALMLVVLTLLGMSSAAGITLLRERVDGSLLSGWGMAVVGAMGLLVPHALHARQQARGTLPVLFAPTVNLLEVMKRESKPGDYMITWWDYGTAGWYHGDCNVIVHPGNQTDDIWIAARILSGTSQREAANLGRVAIEGYAQRGPLAVNHVFKDQLAAKDDSNNDKRDDWSGLPSVSEKGTQDVLATLSLPAPGTGTNQPPGPTYRPPKANGEKRDIFLFLPSKLLGIYPVIRQFSRRDLMPAKEEYKLALLQQAPKRSGEKDPATTKVVKRLFEQAAAKGHAGAQISLAALYQAAYLKALPKPLAHLPAAARAGDSTAKTQLLTYFIQQVEKGLNPEIALAHRSVTRAIHTLANKASLGKVVTKNNSFAPDNPADQLAQARALRTQIALHLPVDLADQHRLEAAQFMPRGAEYPMQQFERVPIKLFDPDHPLYHLGDRYVVDTADLRLYENTGYARYARIPGAVALHPARLAQGMARIQSILRNLANTKLPPNVQRITNSILLALAEITNNSGFTFNPNEQKILAQAIRKHDTAAIAAIASFAVKAAQFHFDHAQNWTASLPMNHRKKHREGKKYWAVKTKDGKTIAGEVKKLTLQHLELTDLVPRSRKDNGAPRTYDLVSKPVAWNNIAQIYRPIGWLNRIEESGLPENKQGGLHKLASGAEVGGPILRKRNTGTEPVHQASRLCLVISHEYGAYLMDRDVYHSNLVQLLLLGAHDVSSFELVYYNEQGRLYRFKR